MLSRIDAINRTTRRIMAGDLSQRISLKGSRDEFDVLAGNLNAMLDQIERLLSGMREVTDNIAHDLRTPLSRMRSRIEVALLADPDRTEARTLLEQTLCDADAMIQSFNALLSIARAEAGSERAAFEPVDLSEVCRDLADLYGPLAEEKGLTFTSACPPAPGPAGQPPAAGPGAGQSARQRDQVHAGRRPRDADRLSRAR